MKPKPYLGLLILTAICSAAFAWFADTGNLLLTALAFPFAPIGKVLRLMSLSGFFGNLLAWMIYLILCALPVIYYGFLHRRNRAKTADLLLLLLSAVLAVVLYNAVNPHGNLLAASDAGLQMLLAQYGAVVYVTLLGRLILRTVSGFAAANEMTLYKALSVFLRLLGVLFVIAAFGGRFGALLETLAAVESSNQNSGNLTLTYLFALFHCIVDALPYLLNTITVILALELLHGFTENSKQTATYAKQLAKWCGFALSCTALAGILFHVSQMLFMNALRNLDASVSIPVGSIAFVAVCLIAAGIVAENKALRDDNDLFI